MRRGMQGLRIATRKDKELVRELTKAFIETENVPFPFSDERFEKSFEFMMSSESIIILLGDYGMLVATVSPSFFSDVKITTEVAWYVHPLYRGKNSLKLLEAYEYWSKEIVKADYCQMMHLNSRILDRLYTKRGYKKIEEAYLKEWH